MRLGIVGRGPWANVYAMTLRKMGIEHWQGTRDYGERHWQCDGMIVASSAESHYDVAFNLIEDSSHVLIEKPMCLSVEEAHGLRRIANRPDGAEIIFTGHTRLYSNAWRAFKAKALAAGVDSVYATAGGACKLSPLWDWGPHLVAMCIDLGVDPLEAHIVTTSEETPLKIIVNGGEGGLTYTDQPETPSPLENLLTEFMAAIELGEPDIRGLELGVRVVETLEQIEERHGAIKRCA